MKMTYFTVIYIFQKNDKHFIRQLQYLTKAFFCTLNFFFHFFINLINFKSYVEIQKLMNEAFFFLEIFAVNIVLSCFFFNKKMCKKNFFLIFYNEKFIKKLILWSLGFAVNEK